MPVLLLSAKTGQGMEELLEFLEARRVTSYSRRTMASGSVI
jgi:hypothetical protein